MLVWAIICLIIAAIAGVFGYKRPKSTFILISKLILYVSLLLFFLLLFAAIFNSAPPQPHDSALLPA